MTYEEKLTATRINLDAAIKAAKAPILWCSFGKKSLIVLDIIWKLGHQVPVFWMRPTEPQAEVRDLVRKLIRDIDLEILDYWPSEYLIHGAPHMELGQVYDLGEGAALPIVFPLRFEAHKVDGWSCIFKLLQKRKREPYPYAWDISVFGSTGKVPEDGSRLGNTLLCFPLRDWETSDLERFAEDHFLPEGIEPEKFPVCSACIDPFYKDQGTTYCPLVDTSINWIDIQIDERNKLWESVTSSWLTTIQ